MPSPESDDVSSARIEDGDHETSPESIHQIQVLKLVPAILISVIFAITVIVISFVTAVICTVLIKIDRRRCLWRRFQFVRLRIISPPCLQTALTTFPFITLSTLAITSL